MKRNDTQISHCFVSLWLLQVIHLLLSNPYYIGNIYDKCQKLSTHKRVWLFWGWMTLLRLDDFWKDVRFWKRSPNRPTFEKWVYLEKQESNSSLKHVFIHISKQELLTLFCTKLRLNIFCIFSLALILTGRKWTQENIAKFFKICEVFVRTSIFSFVVHCQSHSHSEIPSKKTTSD